MKKNGNQNPQKKSSDRQNYHQSYSPNTISLSKLLQKQAELKSKQMHQNITVQRAPVQHQKNFNPSPTEKKIIVGDMIAAYSNESDSHQEIQEKAQKSVFEIIRGNNSITMSTRPGHFNQKQTNSAKNVPRKSPLPVPKSLQTQKYLPMKMSNGLFSSSSIPSLNKESKSTNSTSEQMSKTFNNNKNTPTRSLSPITRKKNTTPKMSPNVNSRANYANNSPISMLMERFKKFQMNNMNLMKNKSKGHLKGSNVNNIKCHHMNNNKGKSTVITMDMQQNNLVEKEQVIISSNSHNNSHSNQNIDEYFGHKQVGYQSPPQSSNQQQKSIEENHPHTYSSPSLVENNNQPSHEKSHSMINTKNPSLNLRPSSSQQKGSQVQAKAQAQDENQKVIKRIKNIYEFTHVGFDGEADKANNQDSYFIHRNFAGHQDYIYMSVCDGHGVEGHGVSGFIKKVLAEDMSYNLRRKDILKDKKVHDVIIQTFLDSNDKLIANEDINSTFSGSTCVSVIYTPERLIVPNIGDSRAVMGRFENNEWKGIDLSRDHKPSEEDEKIRVLENDGRIQPFIDEGEYIGPLRVWVKEDDVPGLAMTRSFGDRVAATVGVVSEPEIKEFDFSEDDKFMLIASDGVWEFIDSTECIKMIKDYYLKNDFRGCCQYIYNESKRRWMREEEVVDDITMILVVFE